MQDKKEQREICKYHNWETSWSSTSIFQLENTDFFAKKIVDYFRIQQIHMDFKSLKKSSAGEPVS